MNTSDAARAMGSVRSERKATSSRENGKKGGRPYRYMLVRRISGRPVSRHATHDAAIKALRRWEDAERDPLELRDYSAVYWSEMG